MKNKIHEINGYIQTIYLVEEESGLLLLDGCCRPDVPMIQKFIEKDLGRPFSDLKLVIATHIHPDHAGGISFFKKKGIPIAGPEGLGDNYDGPIGLIVFWIDLLLTYLVALNKKKGFKNILYPRKVKLDHILRDGDMIPGFNDWVALSCPGHTEVDLSIYNKSEKLIYVADNFVGSEKKIFRPYPLISPEAYRKSLQRYIDLDISEYMIAHYGRIKISNERIEELIKSSPDQARRHINTLPTIMIKLVRSFIKKILS